MKQFAKHKNRSITLRDLDKRFQHVVTKSDLDERFKNVVTKSDLDERFKNVVTKDYFEKRFDEKLDAKLKDYVTKDYLVGYVDMKFAELDERFVTRTEFRKAMDRIYTYFDDIIGILNNQEWEMVKHSMSRHEETLIGHNKRILRLESAGKRA